MTLCPESPDLFFAMGKVIMMIEEARGTFQASQIVLLTRILFFDKEINI
jgi:hypothetical protein